MGVRVRIPCLEIREGLSVTIRNRQDRFKEAQAPARERLGAQEKSGKKSERERSSDSASGSVKIRPTSSRGNQKDSVECEPEKVRNLPSSARSARPRSWTEKQLVTQAGLRLQVVKVELEMEKLEQMRARYAQQKKDIVRKKKKAAKDSSSDE